MRLIVLCCLVLNVFCLTCNNFTITDNVKNTFCSAIPYSVVQSPICECVLPNGYRYSLSTLENVPFVGYNIPLNCYDNTGTQFWLDGLTSPFNSVYLSYFDSVPFCFYPTNTVISAYNVSSSSNANFASTLNSSSFHLLNITFGQLKNVYNTEFLPAIVPQVDDCPISKNLLWLGIMYCGLSLFFIFEYFYGGLRYNVLTIFAYILYTFVTFYMNFYNTDAFYQHNENLLLLQNLKIDNHYLSNINCEEFITYSASKYLSPIISYTSQVILEVIGNNVSSINQTSLSNLFLLKSELDNIIMNNYEVTCEVPLLTDHTLATHIIVWSIISLVLQLVSMFEILLIMKKK
jgi:hypothetical protein